MGREPKSRGERGREPASVGGRALAAVPSATPPAAMPPKSTSGVRTSERAAVVVVAAGDVNLGRETGQRLLADASYDPFRGVAELFQTADLRFVNLESPLSDQDGETQAPGKPLVFTGPPNGAALLARVGIGVVSTANNHAWDYGRAGLLETLKHLQAAGVAAAGTSGRSSHEAYRPRVLEVRGFRVAIFAVTSIWNYGPFFEHPARDHVAWAVSENLRSAVVAAKKQHDFVLVSHHGGDEYTDRPLPRTERFAKQMARFGADAVLGHHPHVVQGAARLGRMPVFYSLGNFVFRKNLERTGTDTGLVVRLTLCRNAKPRVELCPLVIQDSEPVLARGGLAPEGRALLSRVKELSAPYGTASLSATDALGCAAIAFFGDSDAETCGPER